MKNALLPLIFSFAVPALAASSVDWSQPAVGCVEDVVPQAATRPCPDLSSLEDPRPSDQFPSTMSADEIAFWQSVPGQMRYCRSKEILRRDRENPGSVSPVQVQIAWMQASGGDNRDQKIAAVYAASRANQIPAQILTGALYQESLFAELGVAEDGGNYSCGVGQINIQEWCRWAVKQSPAKKKELGWPQEISCSLVPASVVAPYYAIAKSRLNGVPEYRLNKAYFGKIDFAKVASKFPAASPEVQKLRHQAATSFLMQCSNPANGIAAKANELASLYRQFVPAGLKRRDLYPAGQKYGRVCREKGYEKALPLGTGWLLTVGMYNAGPRIVDIIGHYNGWDAQSMQRPETWNGFTPAKMIESFYWGGKYSPKTDRMHFKTRQGGEASIVWFKACVLQRHVARVVQHVTLPGRGPLAASLEAKCSKSRWDSKTGKLISSAVPEDRRMSSGTSVPSTAETAKPGRR